mgnify:CR=1 FL=1
MTRTETPTEPHIPFMGRWQHSRAELIADGIVHTVGIVLAIAAGSALLSVSAFHAGFGEYLAAVFYVVAVLTALSISMTYNLLPVSRAKWILRRFDHSAIYLLIAATYTPFLTQLDDQALVARMIAVVWGAATVGIFIKMVLPGKLDRLAVVFYLALGWSGVVILQPLLDTLPATTLGLILAGGIVYSCGVIFFAWQGLRFQAAVWHGFVVAGTGLHFAAVIDVLVLNRL